MVKRFKAALAMYKNDDGPLVRDDDNGDYVKHEDFHEVAEALKDILLGCDAWEIRLNTGLSGERCKQIEEICKKISQ